MRAVNAGILGATMALALAAGAQASEPVTVVTDQAGDANALANQPVLSVSSPASYAPLDLTAVTLATEKGDLIARIALSGDPSAGGPPTVYRISATTGSCTTRLTAYMDSSASSTGGGGAGFVIIDTCGFWLDSTGVTVQPDGNGLVLRIPSAILAKDGLAPGTVLGAVTAHTRFGVFVASATACSPECPTPPTAPPEVDAHLSDPVGVLIDATTVGADYTIPAEDPPVAG